MTPQLHEFYSWQQQALQPLKYWGLGSVAVGGLCALSPNPIVRHFGYQALTWGAIDAALAFFGERGARSKHAEVELGLRDDAQIAQDWQSLRRLLLINAGLDVVYISTAGWLLATSNALTPRRIGMGWGILVQGAFLLVYDVALAAQLSNTPTPALPAPAA